MEKNQQSSLKSKNIDLTTRNQAKSTGIAKRKRKNKSKNKKKAKQRRLASKKYPNKVEVNLAMSSTSWPLNLYTKASEWQFKHEIAFWKAKAKALECENRILHDIIRKKSGSLSSGIGASTSASITESESGNEEMSSASDDDDNSSASEDEFRRHVENNEQLEVSEAFIDFLTMNAKYKEDARQERERLKSKDFETEEEKVKRMEEPPTVVHEDESEDLEKLYGPRWKRISALEMSLNCQFISDCDKLKPVYWPNIPFNFNFSR